MKAVRVRFAPSPTGALHIGGVRTALYNFLLAKQQKGDFILRVEDTDQARYVEGAEEYIKSALEWCGLRPDEGPGYGGEFGPYRQSERKDIYRDYAFRLVETGHAYYAFDTPEELTQKRKEEQEKGNHTFKYDAQMRLKMRNSISLSAEKVKALLEGGAPYTIRLKVPTNELVTVNDLVRGEVTFQSNELDDKVMLKADGMPTYHLANVVDDKLMEISHVIRGEEWLPSTAHHVLLYRAFNWEDLMPEFAHLPLILRPNGKGKLSKRDGAKFGIPVFPLGWQGATPEDSFKGFKDFGFDPEAVINFLAFLGWNPGTEQEIFSKVELIQAFSVKQIGKSGARFDFDKASWFNQQYLMNTPDEKLAAIVLPLAKEKGYDRDLPFMKEFCKLMKERVSSYNEFLEKGYYFFEPIREYDRKTLKKKWKPERKALFESLSNRFSSLGTFSTDTIKQETERFMEDHELKYGDVLPILRLAISGTTKGPAIFEMMALLGKEEAVMRIDTALETFTHKETPA